MKSRVNSWDLGVIEGISVHLRVWRKPGALHRLIVVWKIWLDHVKDVTLKFNKGRTSVLRNLVQRLKSGAEHEYRPTFLVIFDDSRTVTDAIADIMFCASRSCCIEKRTSSIDWWRYTLTSVNHRTWFTNLSQVKVTNKLSTCEIQMSGDRA